MGNCQAGDLLDTVKAAKHHLLKEKIKTRLESQMGKKLDQMADIAVEMLMMKMEMKKQKMERKDALMSKLQGVMDQGK
jgi:hypothetical protein